MPVDTLALESVVALVRSAAENGAPVTILSSNANKARLAAGDPALRAALEHATVCLPDGMSMVALLRLAGVHGLPRDASGVMLVDRLLRDPVAGSGVFLLGGEPEVAPAVASRIERRYDIELAGVEHGFFEDDEGVLERIAASGARILLAGLGSPRQELWLERWGDRIAAPVRVGVGGSFSVVAGERRLVPPRVRRFGLEWAYRTIQEPRRLGLRTLRNNAWFAAASARWLVSREGAHGTMVGARRTRSFGDGAG
ncbi:MAG: WecB/TagA/CpsF family glycosyltransferase [Dehalococcoidia bacterium]|nr:WecB/TagA/CpsF family glycosyltransferase [Dehalococcoidia bacterium]